MSAISRRSLLSGVAATTAVLVTTRSNVFAQPVYDDREFESVLTGSVISLLDSQWSFNDDSYQMTNEADLESELVSIENGSATVEIEFVKSSMGPDAYLEYLQGVYTSSFDEFEIVESGAGADGAWFAGAISTDQFALSVYCEYQAGAYEDADLVVILYSKPTLLLDDLAALQDGVTIGDLPPLALVESSKVEAIVFPGTATTTTTNRRSNRTSTTKTGQTSTVDTSYVEDVRSHRDTFLTSFDEFSEALSAFADEASSEASKDEAIVTINRVCADWSTYADQAAELTAPAEFANLESAYLEWADAITELGFIWQDIVNGATDASAMITQIDVVSLADEALAAELDAQA